MKVLFLDVDGVLNNEPFFHKFHEEEDAPFLIDPACLLQLVRIVEETGCKIVLSSSWRGYDFAESILEKHFNTFGLKIWDKTPRLSLSHSPRRREIRDWLEKNKDLGIVKYATVDDDRDADLGEGEFFRTTPEKGLTSKIAGRIINRLTEGD